MMEHSLIHSALGSDWISQLDASCAPQTYTLNWAAGYVGPYDLRNQSVTLMYGNVFVHTPDVSNTLAGFKADTGAISDSSYSCEHTVFINDFGKGRVENCKFTDDPMLASVKSLTLTWKMEPVPELNNMCQVDIAEVAVTGVPAVSAPVTSKLAVGVIAAIVIAVVAVATVGVVFAVRYRNVKHRRLATSASAAASNY
ncbi:hypothetical protein HK101_003917 [Irineochytrium annulatum]|nr:hypothetical protein HK101_003917 [Irineochytrium annulatum]